MTAIEVVYLVDASAIALTLFWVVRESIEIIRLALMHEARKGLDNE